MGAWDRSGLNFVAGFGALLVSGNVLDLLGRRWTIMVASMLLIAGGVVVATAPSFPVLLLGRALQGLGSGCSWAACSVYITELAPTEIRGSLVTLADISINLGILIGYCVDYAVRTQMADNRDLSWRLGMGLSGVFPLMYCLAFPCLPETPRWLVMKGRDKDALVVIRRTCGKSEAGARQELQHLKAAQDRQTQGALTWAQTWCPSSRATTYIVWIAVALGLAQQLTGTEAILYYTPVLFANLSESHQFLANLSVGFCKLFGELVAASMAECVGRRKLMIYGNFALCASVFGIALSFLYDGGVIVSVACLSAVMLTFSIGAGPFTFVVVNEMLPLQFRGKGVATSVFFNRLGSGTVALTFLSLKNAVGVPNAFFMYGGFGLLTTLFYIMVLPDLAGVSLEDNQGKGEATHADINGKGTKRDGSPNSEEDNTGVCCSVL